MLNNLSYLYMCNLFKNLNIYNKYLFKKATMNLLSITLSHDENRSILKL